MHLVFPLLLEGHQQLLLVNLKELQGLVEGHLLANLRASLIKLQDLEELLVIPQHQVVHQDFPIKLQYRQVVFVDLLVVPQLQEHLEVSSYLTSLQQVLEAFHPVDHQVFLSPFMEELPNLVWPITVELAQLDEQLVLVEVVAFSLSERSVHHL